MARILAADIGGTNCRLGHFSEKDNELVLEAISWIDTGSIAHTEELMEAFEKKLSKTPHEVDAVVVAIAGPVEDFSRGTLTNGGLVVDFAPLNASGKRFFLINDFMAQAYAVLSPEGERAKHIAGPDKPLRDGTRAVIGAGTGLGQAYLTRLNPGTDGSPAHWMSVPSESGHVGFPFVTDREHEFGKFLCKELAIPYATGDDAITGRGLACLHHFLTGNKLTPAEVGQTALNEESETLAWYARLYGRACRNWMLTTLCDGGLWIAGGIAAKNPKVITSPEFRNELYGSPKWTPYLKTIPVYLMENVNSGVWGAARFGQQQVDMQ